MFEVNCSIKSETKNDPRNLVVKSVMLGKEEKKTYRDKDYVDIAIGDANIRVYGPDLVQAIDNCMNNGSQYGRCRRYPLDDE